MKLVKSLIPYMLFATMTYLGTRYAFPTWTEEGNGSVTWVEEDGGTSQTYKLFDYHVIFSSSIQLPTAPGSITGAGVDTGFDSDKLDGQHGAYYLNASSGSALTPLTVFNSSMTDVENLAKTKLSASSGTTIAVLVADRLISSSGTALAVLVADRLINSSGTVLAELIPTRLNASSGTTTAVLIKETRDTATSSFTVIMSSFNAIDTYQKNATATSASSWTVVMSSFIAVDVTLNSLVKTIASTYTVIMSSFGEVERRLNLASPSGLPDQLNVVKSSHVTTQVGTVGQALIMSATGFTFGTITGGGGGGGIKWALHLYPNDEDIGTAGTIIPTTREYIHTVFGASVAYTVLGFAKADTTSIAPYMKTIDNTYASGSVMCYIKYISTGGVNCTGTMIPIVYISTVNGSSLLQNPPITSTTTFETTVINAVAYTVYTSTALIPAPFAKNSMAQICVKMSGTYNMEIDILDVYFEEQ